jgi:hypothetical protein
MEESKYKAARTWCPNCKEYHDSRSPEISIRSMLFARRKLNVIDDKELKELDKSWKKFREKNRVTF